MWDHWNIKESCTAVGGGGGEQRGLHTYSYTAGILNSLFTTNLWLLARAARNGTLGALCESTGFLAPPGVVPLFSPPLLKKARAA